MSEYYRLSNEDYENKILVNDILKSVGDKYRVFRKRIILSIIIILLAPFTLLLPVQVVYKILFFFTLLLLGVAVFITALYLDVRIINFKRFYYPLIGISLPFNKNNIILYDMLNNGHLVIMKTIDEHYVSKLEALKKKVNGIKEKVFKTLYKGIIDKKSMAITGNTLDNVKTIATYFEQDVARELKLVKNSITEPGLLDVKLSLFKPCLKKLDIDKLKPLELSDFEQVLTSVNASHYVDVENIKEKVEAVFKNTNTSTSFLNDIGEVLSEVNRFFNEYYSWLKSITTNILKLLNHVLEVFTYHACPYCLISERDYGGEKYPWVLLEDYVDEKYIGKCSVCNRRYSVDETISMPKIMRLFISTWNKLYRKEVVPVVNSAVEHISTIIHHLLSQTILIINYFCIDEEREVLKTYGRLIDPVFHDSLKECIESINEEFMGKIKSYDRITIPVEYLGEWVIRDKLEACRKLRDSGCKNYSLFKKAFEEGDYVLLRRIIEGDKGVFEEVVVEGKDRVEKRDPCRDLEEVLSQHEAGKDILYRLDMLRKYLDRVVKKTLDLIKTISTDVVNSLSIKLPWLSTYNEWVNSVRYDSEDFLSNIRDVIIPNSLKMTLNNKVVRIIDELLAQARNVADLIRNIDEENKDKLNEYVIEINKHTSKPLVFLVPVYRIDILAKIKNGKVGEIRSLTRVFTEITGGSRDKLIAEQDKIKDYVNTLFNKDVYGCIDEDVLRKLINVIDSKNVHGFLQRLFLKKVLFNISKGLLCREGG